jgi:tetratricopeptide (TPR) repeat protein
MERIEKTVFISYRRTNAPWALAIYQNLESHGFDVFFDYAGIASGDFEQVILGNIRARAHFLVLLTPSALERCGEPEDSLRREIEAAMASKRNIVPLMLEGFSFGSPSIAQHLTGRLEVLKRYNGLDVPIRYFKYAMQELQEKYLNLPLSAVLHPLSPAVASASAEQMEGASTAPPVQPKELTAQEWFERGISTADEGEKIHCFTEAIRLKPDFANAFALRGIARDRTGDLDGALSDYDEAIRIEPGDDSNLYLRGIVRRERGDLDGAISDYNEAIRINRENVHAFILRGIARREEGDLDGAAQDHTEAIRLSPKSASAFRHRGWDRMDKGDEAGAQEDFAIAKRLEEEDQRSPNSDEGPATA